MDKKHERTEEALTRLAGQFILHESNRSSLVTVTRSDVSDDYKTARIFISVLPEEKEGEAISFLKRKRTEFREFIMEKAKLPKTPFVDFLIDQGEKNRQRIENLSKRD